MAMPPSPTAPRCIRAGVTRDTPNPFGGRILKDKETGEPTGMLLDHAHDRWWRTKFRWPPTAPREKNNFSRVFSVS